MSSERIRDLPKHCKYCQSRIKKEKLYKNWEEMWYCRKCDIFFPVD